MMRKKITKVCIDKNLEIPTVFVRLHGAASFGFKFIIDTSVKHNLLDPCFFEEWIVPPTEEIVLSPSFAKYPPITAVYQDKGEQMVICKDGTERLCEMIKLDFTIEEEKYSELFAIDSSMCQYLQSKKSNSLAGILGNDFFRKQKWIFRLLYKVALLHTYLYRKNKSKCAINFHSLEYNEIIQR